MTLHINLINTFLVKNVPSLWNSQKNSFYYVTYKGLRYELHSYVVYQRTLDFSLKPFVFNEKHMKSPWVK